MTRGFVLTKGYIQATTYSATLTTMSDYTYTTMPGELSSGLGVSVSIAIPTIPTSFFPGLTPYSKLLANTFEERGPVQTAAPKL
ncbi:hypothetical protein F5Y16DRAFT_391348 [Xylariaceae sp. FL0255]|nr:hypothetical protein F5Y16DRAFT_391348 [Xylariaceae sp. FL0255]